MRPARLELSGFLSYREPTAIDLSGVNAAAIVGHNGAGKTSIVEAIGWALYGKGRGRGPDDFVSAGATECRVAFYFELGDARYRTQRQRSLSAGGKSYLGLEVDTNDHDGFGWQPVGGDSIAETQAAIEQLLGMDFETWERTSYIGQGRADAFTRLRPAERKELLADVLGLNVYERLEQLARGKERELAGVHTGLLRRSEQFEDFLAGEGSAHAALAQAAEEWDVAQDDVARFEGDYAAAIRALELARAEIAKVAHIVQQLEFLRQARTDKVRQLQHLLEQRARDKQDLEAEARGVEALVLRLRTSAEDATALEAKAQANRLEAETLEARAEQLKAMAATQEAAASVASEQARTAGEAIARIKHRIAALGESRESSCFTCGQPLTLEQRNAILRQLEDEWRRSTEDAASFEQRARTEASAADELRQEAAGCLTQAAQLAGEVDELQRAAERALAHGERIPHEEGRLASLWDRISAQEIDLQRVREQLTNLQEPSDEERRLEDELAAARTLETSATRYKEKADSLAAELAAARERLTEAAGEHGRAKEVLAAYERARQDLEAIRRETAETGRLRFGYDTLATAFGRNGIPALIIENAVPQIDAEANRLLAKLTEGRLSARIDSLRATRSGGLRETLDITVADETSERPLESLSGGERQCVDLALRIALARLLAHRAGTRIETLILDEAFTALDAGHRQRTVEVLHGLLEEFSCLLFITHLQELADAFPARFLVTKEEGSSRVEQAA